jgi:hypothetical protein
MNRFIAHFVAARDYILQFNITHTLVFTVIENYRSTEGPASGPASGHKATRTAEKTDPGRWWIPAEVGRRPRTVDPPPTSGSHRSLVSSDRRWRQQSSLKCRNTGSVPRNGKDNNIFELN